MCSILFLQLVQQCNLSHVTEPQPASGYFLYVGRRGLKIQELAFAKDYLIANLAEPLHLTIDALVTNLIEPK